MKPTVKYNHKSKNVIVALGIKGGKKMESKLAKIGVGAYVQSDCMSEAVEFIISNTNSVEEAILAAITCGSTAEKTRTMHARPSSSPGGSLQDALMAAIASGGKSLPPGVGIGVVGPDGRPHMLSSGDEENGGAKAPDEDEEKNNGQGYIY
jgi:hypothetical protein